MTTEEMLDSLWAVFAQIWPSLTMKATRKSRISTRMKSLRLPPMTSRRVTHNKACAVNPLVASAARAEKVPTGVISRGACGFIRFYASHSDLWASHQAGKLGSFGERVGTTLEAFIAEIIFGSDGIAENSVIKPLDCAKQYSLNTMP